jgi:hypothetical protein
VFLVGDIWLGSRFTPDGVACQLRYRVWYRFVAEITSPNDGMTIDMSFCDDSPHCRQSGSHLVLCRTKTETGASRRHHPYIGVVRWSRRLRRLLQSALAGLYGSICKASFRLGMGGCDSSRRPATNSRNIPGSFEFCKAVRSGGPLPPLRRRTTCRGEGNMDRRKLTDAARRSGGAIVTARLCGRSRHDLCISRR